MIFHDYTMLATGEILSHRQHDSDQLNPAAVEAFELFAIQAQAEGIVTPGLPHIRLLWTADGGAALATFFAHDIHCTASFLACDQLAWPRLQSAINQLVATFGQQASELHVEFPCIVSVPLPTAARDDVGMIADMETCLAAAYFLEVANNNDPT